MKKIQSKKIKIDSVTMVFAMLAMIFATEAFAAPDTSAASSVEIKAEDSESKTTSKDTDTPTATDLKYEGSGAVLAAPAEPSDSLTSRISGYASLNYSVKAYEDQGKNDPDSFGYTLGLGYKINELYSAGLSASIYNNVDELEEREQLKLESIAVSANRAPFELPNNFKLATSLSVRLPVGRDTVKRESLILGVNPSASLSLPVKDWTGWSKFSSGVMLSAFYNIHEYKQTASGGSNRQWGYTPAFRLGYELPKKFDLSASASYNSGYTYAGTQVESIGHSESLSWAFLENASASIGHSNRGPLFAYAGVNYDFSLLSEKSSYFFGELTVSF